jgi:hypothetical protein
MKAAAGAGGDGAAERSQGGTGTSASPGRGVTAAALDCQPAPSAEPILRVACTRSPLRLMPSDWGMANRYGTVRLLPAAPGGGRGDRLGPGRPAWRPGLARRVRAAYRPARHRRPHQTRPPRRPPRCCVDPLRPPCGFGTVRRSTWRELNSTRWPLPLVSEQQLQKLAAFGNHGAVPRIGSGATYVCRVPGLDSRNRGSARPPLPGNPLAMLAYRESGMAFGAPF